MSKPNYAYKQNIAKILRTSGQSIFLACNAVLLATILVTIRNNRRDNKKIHPTLILLLIAWFPLIVRGIFGVLQSADWGLSYYNRMHPLLDSHGSFTKALVHSLGKVFQIYQEHMALEKRIIICSTRKRKCAVVS